MKSSNPIKISLSNGYTLQLAKETHIPSLSAIEESVGAMFTPGSIPESVLAERVPRDVFADAVSQGRLLAVLDASQIPVGFAFWQNIGAFALLALIEVSPPHGQKGLGKALVLQVINQVAEAGFQQLYLTTFSNIPWNAPFYQKLGFVLLNDEEQPDFIKDILLEERGKGLRNRVAMRYSIQPA